MAKKLKGNSLIHFVRYGGLNLKKQKGYGKDTFHAPPVKRGIYAFPLCAVEIFLIGSLPQTQSDIFPKKPKYPKNKEINGELSEQDAIEWYNIMSNFDYDKYERKVRKIKSLIRRTFTKSEGTIWHHLKNYVKSKDIISENNSWIKTSIQVWQKAIVKASLNCRFGDKIFVNNSKLFGWYAKDEFEVFFDEKV